MVQNIKSKQGLKGLFETHNACKKITRQKYQYCNLEAFFMTENDKK